MFDLVSEAPVRVRRARASWEPLAYRQLDEAKTELAWPESQIARARARQAEILSFLSAHRAHDVEGARSMQEWTAAKLDVTPATARDLVTFARAREQHPRVRNSLAGGEVTFDRAVALSHLAAAGGDDDEVAAADGLDLTRVKRRTAELKRITPVAEAEVVRRRHVTLVPTLGHDAWQLVGLLPAVDGQLVAEALRARAERFPALSDGTRESLAQRQADALAALAMDWLDADAGNETEHAAAGGAEITVFVDAAEVARTAGERGATIAGGPRIGPDTLWSLLCEGRVGLVVLDDAGRPVAATDHRHAIPPAVRAAVLQRDEGCVVDGCRSRYRLEVHHVHHRAALGGNEMTNLVTLCWYHHHVAIHRNGHEFEPDAPDRRRRLSRRPRAPDPHR